MIIHRATAEQIPGGKLSRFTGDAFSTGVLPPTDGVTINTITFTPGARTHWHRHEGGQILQVIAGYGLICSEGSPVEQLLPGDTIWIPAGERHWHGASPTSSLTHTAISLGTTDWETPVTDSEYSPSIEQDGQ
jgi:quercetin dioxygenase-like cupin family protein